MTIAIDARLNAYRNGGIPQYTQQLINAWCGDASFPPLQILQSRRQKGRLSAVASARFATLYTPPHHHAEAYTLPFEIGLRRPSVVLFPDFIAPTLRTFPAVVTIHDLAFLHFDDLLDDAARAFYSRINTSSTHADAIIAVSNSTKTDIVNLLDIDPTRIHVISEAAAPFARPVTRIDGEIVHLMEGQLIPLGWLIPLGAVFVTGAGMLLSGLLLPQTITGPLAYAMAALGLAGTGLASVTTWSLDRSASNRLEAARGQSAMVHKQRDDLLAQCGLLDKKIPTDAVNSLERRAAMAQAEFERLEELAAQA